MFSGFSSFLCSKNPVLKLNSFFPYLSQKVGSHNLDKMLVFVLFQDPLLIYSLGSVILISSAGAIATALTELHSFFDSLCSDMLVLRFFSYFCLNINISAMAIPIYVYFIRHIKLLQICNRIFFLLFSSQIS